MMKPSNSSTQGQPNPRKTRVKVALGPLFPHGGTGNIFSVGWDWFYVRNSLQETEPNQILLKHPTTGDHTNQDLRSRLKTIYSPIFANHIWS